MSKARFILVLLICASPAILLGDGLIMQGLIAGIVAVGLAIAALTLRRGETEFLVSIIRPVPAVAAVPALWVLFQVLPLGVLSHPIWASAKSVLGHAVTGAISVDPGASVVALGQYLALGAVVLLSAAVAVERGRAEWLLFALTGAGAIFALMVAAHDLFFPALEFSPFAHAQAVDCVAMGVIFAIAACIRTLERYETRHATPQRSVAILLRTFMASGAALAICTLALILDGAREVLVATGCGLVVIAWIAILRRFGLGAWGIAPFGVLAIGAAILLFTSHPIEHGRNLLLTFAASSPASPTGVSERMLEDAPLVGTGAGTFAALAPIYREMDDPPSGSVASTTAATLAIELGSPMFWLIVAATVTLLLVLLKASLQRGRDSFYPATGGSCLVTLLLLTFVNPGLLGDAAGLNAAVALGLSIAQSKSRTMQL